jgi:hypothetical protein
MTTTGNEQHHLPSNTRIVVNGHGYFRCQRKKWFFFWDEYFPYSRDFRTKEEACHAVFKYIEEEAAHKIWLKERKEKAKWKDAGPC